MTRTTLKLLIITSSTLALSNCIGSGNKSPAFGSYQPDKDAFVATSGYAEEDVTEFSPNTPQGSRLVYSYNTEWAFERYPDKSELELGCRGGACGWRFARIPAGEYRLKGYRIMGNYTDYDSARCGIIQFTVRPGEILHIGTLKGGRFEAENEKTNHLILPEFTVSNISNKEKAALIRDLQQQYKGIAWFNSLTDTDKQRVESIRIEDIIMRPPVNIEPKKAAACIASSSRSHLYVPSQKN